MNEAIWGKLTGDKLAPNLQLHELVFSDAIRALFRADYLDTAENSREVLVRMFFDKGCDSRETINRFLEATYLDHPHLLRYITAGALLTDEGRVAYAATERSDLWGSDSLAVDEALEFAQHVISGLEYLHARDLVYCVLSPDTVVPVGTDWKLSDFSHLRVAGTDTSDEALSLATSLATSPPEAAEGLFSPAWDIWTLGQTLRKVLTGYKAHTVDPFRGVILACLHMDPAARPTLSQISTLLQAGPTDQRAHGLQSAARA